MTAPGQEPDEILTAKPQDTDEPEPDTPGLDKAGDAHLPEDLREAAAEKGRKEASAGEPAGESTDTDE